MALTWYRHFQRNGGLNQILRRQNLPLPLRLNVPVVTITAFLTILGQIRYNSSQRSTLWKRSSSYTIWFQMRCWMTSCLNHYYLILIFIHFPYLLYENPSFIIVSAETEYFSTRSWYRNINFFKRSNKANLFIALFQ
jgi:hypothetical protein